MAFEGRLTGLKNFAQRLCRLHETMYIYLLNEPPVKGKRDRNMGPLLEQ